MMECYNAICSRWTDIMGTNELGVAEHGEEPGRLAHQKYGR